MDQWLLVYVAIGAFIGFFAGMLGMGGGGIQVPLTTMAFAAQGFPREHMLHVALGTAMATVIFTSLSSLRAHDRHGAVNWGVLRRLLPGVVVGTGLGTLLARHIPTFPLAVIFVVFVLYMASSMLFNWKPKPTRQLPGTPGLLAAGAVIGVCSALAAMGGATLTIPFLVFCNVPFHTAIGTASAIGFPIALVGTMGYLVNGWGAAACPLRAWATSTCRRWSASRSGAWSWRRSARGWRIARPSARSSGSLRSSSARWGSRCWPHWRERA